MKKKYLPILRKRNAESLLSCIDDLKKSWEDLDKFTKITRGIDDTRKYKDLFYPYAPVEVEVKTVGYPAAVPLELKRCADRKQEAWRGFPDYVVVWVGDRKSGNYYHEGTYIWCHYEKKYKKNVSS